MFLLQSKNPSRRDHLFLVSCRIMPSAEEKNNSGQNVGCGIWRSGLRCECVALLNYCMILYNQQWSFSNWVVFYDGTLWMSVLVLPSSLTPAAPIIPSGKSHQLWGSNMLYSKAFHFQWGPMPSARMEHVASLGQSMHSIPLATETGLVICTWAS